MAPACLLCRTTPLSLGRTVRGVARAARMIGRGSVRAHSSHRDAVNRLMAGPPARLVRARQQPGALHAQRKKEGQPAPGAQHGLNPPGSRVASGAPPSARRRGRTAPREAVPSHGTATRCTRDLVRLVDRAVGSTPTRCRRRPHAQAGGCTRSPTDASCRTISLRRSAGGRCGQNSTRYTSVTFRPGFGATALIRLVASTKRSSSRLSARSVTVCAIARPSRV